MPPDTIERSTPALRDPTLLRHQCYVDGKWIDAADRATLQVDDPANGLPIGTIPRCRGTETRQAIEAATSRSIPAFHRVGASGSNMGIAPAYLNQTVEPPDPTHKG